MIIDLTIRRSKIDATNICRPPQTLPLSPSPLPSHLLPSWSAVYPTAAGSHLPSQSAPPPSPRTSPPGLSPACHRCRFPCPCAPPPQVCPRRVRPPPPWRVRGGARGGCILLHGALWPDPADGLPPPQRGGPVRSRGGQSDSGIWSSGGGRRRVWCASPPSPSLTDGGDETRRDTTRTAGGLFPHRRRV